MPRNGGGTYVLPESAFVAGTAISSAAVNDDLSDIATALTDSLARDGQGGMTLALPLDSAGLGFTYLVDTNTGMRRSGDDEQAIVCGGDDIVTVGTDGAEIDGDLEVTGVLTQGGATLAPIPVGLGPLPFSGSVAPDGWLLCYGQSLLRADYPALFAVIGTTWGAVDGTHFSLPDGRGRVEVGKDDMGGAAANRITDTLAPNGQTLGAAGGIERYTLVTSQMPSHVHPVVDPGHTHGTNAANNAVGGNWSGAGGNPYAVVGGAGTAINAASNVTGITVSSTGGDLPHINVQPGIVTNKIIFAGV